MQTVLITGGAGYIGSHAVLAFREAGYDPVVFDDFSNASRAAVPEGVRCIIGDLRDRDFVEKSVARIAPEGIVHFAGAVVVPESFQLPLKYYERNVAATLNLLRAMQRHSLARIVFSSSAAVYGIPPHARAREDSPLAPISPYGWSKLFAERAIQDFCTAHSKQFAILRYFNVAGADLQMRAGQQGKNNSHLLKRICMTMTGQRQSLPLFGTHYDTPDGTCLRDYIHVSDLAELHVRAYRHLETTAESVLCNCGYGRGVSVREAIACAEQIGKSPLPVREQPARQGDPPALIAETTRLKSLFADWKPQHDSLATIIGSALEWERRLQARAKDT